jgi:hypothetical protein
LIQVAGSSAGASKIAVQTRRLPSNRGRRRSLPAGALTFNDATAGVTAFWPEALEDEFACFFDRGL